MERIENRMVNNSFWTNKIHKLEVELLGPGWTNITDGTFVPDESAFDYAIDHCTNFVPAGFRKIEWTDEFREMLVEWFYSGGEWRKVE